MRGGAWVALLAAIGCGSSGGAASDVDAGRDAAIREDAGRAAEVADAASDARVTGGAGGHGEDAGTEDADTEDTEPDASVGEADTPFERRVIYLVMPDRFANGDSTNDRSGVDGCFDPDSPVAYHGGDLDGLVARLDHIEALGSDAVWTTPLYAQARGRPDRPCPYHGYWADFTVPDDGSVEPRLGGAPALGRLREALRDRGWAMVLDVVVNHAADHARIVAERPGWFHDEGTCAEEGDPLRDCPFRPGAPDFAQENTAVASYLTELHVGWLRRTGASALRMDTARHVPPRYFRVEFLPAMREERPDLHAVAEVFSDDWAELAAYRDAGFDGVLLFPIASALRRGFGEGRSLDEVADAVQRGLERLGPDSMRKSVLFLDNHDLVRFASLPGLGVPSDRIAARLRTALVALFTLPGVPQLYQGDELGLYGGDDPDNRHDYPDWAWTEGGRAERHPAEAAGIPGETFDRVAALARLRRERKALFRGEYAELWRPNGGPNGWVYARWTADDLVLVALNASDAPFEASVPLAPSALPSSVEARLPNDTTLHGFIGEDAVVVDGHLEVAVPPREARVLTFP